MKITLIAGSLLIATSLIAQIAPPKPGTEKAKPTLSPRGTNKVDVGKKDDGIGRQGKPGGFALPKWSDNAVIYEVNLRQFTPSGTINEFVPQMDRLKEMGVKILWFMPIQPIGVKNRKGSLGSYYSIKDYMAINPEHGTMEDWIVMVKKAHQLGMKVILDWVGNHTAFDHAWITSHPEYYTKDEKGNIIPPVADWSDVADLNYDNKDMRKAMIEAMKFWLRGTDIDGFRCDVAEMIPVDFWQECIRDLKQAKRDIFMLAEGEKANLHDKAFDATYTWNLFGGLNDIAAGKKTVKAIDDYLATQTEYPASAIRMYFTSNHDENSWHGSNWEKMGDKSKAFAVLTYALKGMPLIYSGQEADMRKRLRFFDKDTIDFKNLSLNDFYTRLNKLKATEPALMHGERAGELIRLKTGADDQVFACLRKKDNSKVLFIVNLSAKKSKVKLESDDLTGELIDIFDAKGTPVPSKSTYSTTIEPWSYQVFRYKKQ